MSFTQKENNQAVPKAVRNRMTQAQLESMNRVAQPFLNERGMLANDGLEKLKHAMGVVNEKGAVIVYPNGSTRYEQAVLDIDQLQFWRTVRRRRHDQGFCRCVECVTKYSLEVQPVTYRV